MSKHLEFTHSVILQHPETSEVHTFLPGDEVPEWAEVGDHVVALAKRSEKAAQTTIDDVLGVDEVEEPEEPAETGEASEDDSEPGADDESDDVPPYSEWSKTDLQNEVKGRGLEGLSKANIAELVEALEADDEKAE